MQCEWCAYFFLKNKSNNIFYNFILTLYVVILLGLIKKDPIVIIVISKLSNIVYK